MANQGSKPVRCPSIGSVWIPEGPVVKGIPRVVMDDGRSKSIHGSIPNFRWDAGVGQTVNSAPGRKIMHHGHPQRIHSRSLRSLHKVDDVRRLRTSVLVPKSLETAYRFLHGSRLPLQHLNATSRISCPLSLRPCDRRMRRSELAPTAASDAWFRLAGTGFECPESQDDVSRDSKRGRRS